MLTLWVEEREKVVSPIEITMAQRGTRLPAAPIERGDIVAKSSCPFEVSDSQRSAFTGMLEYSDKFSRARQ